ncbi:MAG: hypothetical protein KatS3mg022_3407 [Armatimonadota bacterium]|nr:MAG: hypothetical protein KatS3mg022_3407 [Armatimonadota bacterium]
MRLVRAFTLVEMLVVLAIIAALVALILGVVQLGRRYAYRGTCMSNMRQLVAAVKMYYDGHDVPPMYTGYRTPITGRQLVQMWDRVQPGVAKLLLCPSDPYHGVMYRWCPEVKPREPTVPVSSYQLDYLHEWIQCEGRWSPQSESERMWFNCFWHSGCTFPRSKVTAFADGHVKVISSGEYNRYIELLDKACP